MTAGRLPDTPGDFSDFELDVRESSALSEGERRELQALFEQSYRQANPEFLERSLKRLRYVARSLHEGKPSGFALGETRWLELPRLPAQSVSMAGICCIRSDLRRRGLFGKLAALTLGAGDAPQPARRLLSGRMAHPAALRRMAASPTVVPKPGVPPTAWQREVGQAIAEAYGVYGFDAETFVCLGNGVPIGYPIIDFEVEPHEWEVFGPVNRDRGDALLALAWHPDAPPGW